MQKISAGKFHFEPPSHSSSLDHLVGAGEQRWRNIEAEGSCCLEVDDELELGGLNHRQIGRFDALENLTGHNADLTKHIENIGSIAHEPARFDHLTRKIIRWHS